MKMIYRRLFLVFVISFLFSFSADAQSVVPCGVAERSAALRKQNDEREKRIAEAEKKLLYKDTDAILADVAKKALSATALLELSRNGKPAGSGSGTAVECWPSLTQKGKQACLIVTAAHLFSDDKNNPINPNNFVIKATFFDNREPVLSDLVVVPLRDPKNNQPLIDTKNDVFVGIAYPDYPLPVLPLAFESYMPKNGTKIVGVGCPAGIAPVLYTPSSACIVAFENGRILTSCQPRSGISGASLTDASGRLIGICTGYEVEGDKRGIFPSSQYAHDLIDRYRKRF